MYCLRRLIQSIQYFGCYLLLRLLPLLSSTSIFSLIRTNFAIKSGAVSCVPTRPVLNASLLITNYLLSVAWVLQSPSGPTALHRYTLDIYWYCTTLQTCEISFLLSSCLLELQFSLNFSLKRFPASKAKQRKTLLFQNIELLMHENDGSKETARTLASLKQDCATERIILRAYRKRFLWMRP